MNILARMRTVEAILTDVYGGLSKAAPHLGAKKSAPWNWKKWGHFPASVAIKIFEDAKRQGMNLPMGEIPTLERKGHRQ
jgi:hypothetical protein